MVNKDFLVNAMRENVDVSFTYVNVSGTKRSSRIVTPVEFVGDVLVAFDNDVDDYRRFALKNMTDIAIAE